MKKIEWQTLDNSSDGSNFVDIIWTHLNLFFSKLLRMQQHSSPKEMDGITQIEK